MSEPEPVGARIRRLRTERGLSQDRLAIEAHVDQSGLSKFERGRDRTMGNVQLTRIARVLGLELADLITGTDYETK
jgi:transcriptional regulator with XRE-family HTH domain